MPQFPIACVALVSVLVMAAPPWAAGQGAPRAVCEKCQPLAVQIADLEPKWEEAQKLFYQELGESMALMREDANDRVEISQIQRTRSPEEAAKLIKEIEARIAARAPAIKEHSDRATHHSRQARAIRTEIARLAGELERCNLRCQTPAGTPPPPLPSGTGGGEPPAPPPLPPDDTPVPVSECPVCKDLATRLNSLLQQRRAARGTLETVVNSRGAWEEEIAEREAELKKLQAGRQNNRADDREVAVEDRLGFAREQLQESEKYREFWEGEIKRLDAEIAPLRSEFERCYKACKPSTETGSLFSQPKVYVALAAGLGGVFLATAGGSDGSSTAGTATTNTQPPARSTITLRICENHVGPSFAGVMVGPDPSMAGETVTLQAMGPFVIPGQNLSAVLDASGAAFIPVRISQPGPVTIIASVRATTGIESSATTTFTVTGTNQACASVP